MTADHRVNGLLSLSSGLTRSESPLLDCQMLLGHCIGQPRNWLIAHNTDVVCSGIVAKYKAMLDRRQRGEPIAYIIGHRDFWEQQLMVNTATLIPRPETELLVELALSTLPAAACDVLDLGTGSGAIAIALANERRNWDVYASDRSAAALEVARGNARTVSNVRFFRGCWTNAIRSGSFDLVVCNPPYISAQDPHLSVLQYEPADALVSADNGLRDIRDVAQGARRILRPGSALIVEHGYDQPDAASQILLDLGYTDIERFNDPGGLPRAIRATSR